MPNEPLPEWEALLSSAAPVGSLDGIETGIRQLIREKPLETATLDALRDFDGFYPQPNGQSARQQLQIQLANPMPYDLEETNLREYKKLRPEYQDWAVVAEKCREIAASLW